MLGSYTALHHHTDEDTQRSNFSALMIRYDR